jgi:hypothetical protein
MDAVHVEAVAPPTSMKHRLRCLAVGSLAFLAVFAVLVATFPYVLFPLRPGLDASYLYAINAAVAEGLSFGRDVVFTYGPLGYLLLPHDIGDNLIQAMVFRYTLMLLWGCAWGRLAIRSGSACLLFVSLAAYLIAVGIGLTFEYQVLLVLLTLLNAAARGTHRYDGLWLVPAACLAVACMFMKFSMGVAATGSLIVYAGLLVLRHDAKRKHHGLVLGLSWGLTALIAGLWFIPNPLDAIRWLRASMEMSSGYSEAMSLAGDTVLLAQAVVLALAMGLMALLNGRQGRVEYALALPVVFIAFKHGFVRQDEHVMLFAPCIAGFLACSFVSATGARRQKAHMLLYLLAVVFSLTAHMKYSQVNNGFITYEGLTGRTGWSNFVGVPRLLRDHRVNLKAIGADNLTVDRLPPAVADPIRAQDLSVDALPRETSLIPANDFDWKPGPCLQLYQAYTPFLDSLSAKHYRTKGADRLLVRSETCDGRHLYWDTPLVWRAIAQSYRVAITVPERQLLVLELYPERPAYKTVYNLLTNDVVTPGQSITVPRAKGPVILYATMRKRVMGKLLGVIFRTGPVFIQLTMDDDTVVRHRVIPAQLVSGIRISPLPESLDELASDFTGTLTSRVEYVSFEGLSLNLFDWPLDIVWREEQRK